MQNWYNFHPHLFLKYPYVHPGCNVQPAMKRTLVPLLMLVTVTAGLACNVHAQLVRTFPPDSKLGELMATKYPEIRISGQTMYLGAGGQIRGKDNLIILPTMLNEFGSVRYQTDIMGNVHRIWLLTPAEAVQAKEEEKIKSRQNQ